MPTIASRPNATSATGSLSVDEIAGIITDAVLYTMPSNLAEMRLCLHVVGRTLWNTGVIADYFIYDVSAGVDVGFKLFDNPNYHVITIS